MSEDIISNKIFFSRFGMPIWVAWAIISALLISGHFILAYSTKSTTYVIAFAAEGFLIFLAGMAPSYVLKRLLGLDKVYYLLIDDCAKNECIRISNKRKTAFSNTRIFLKGLPFLIFMTPVILIFFREHSGPMELRIYDCMLSCITFYLCGIGLLLVPTILMEWYSLVCLPLRGTCFLFPWEATQPISQAAVSFSLLGAIAYILMNLFRWFGPTQFGAYGFFYLLSGVVLWFTIYLPPQWFLHLILRKMKIQLLANFAKEFSSNYRFIEAVPFPHQFDNLDKLLSIYDRLRHLPEWPPPLQPLPKMIGSFVLATAPIVIKYYFNLY